MVASLSSSSCRRHCCGMCHVHGIVGDFVMLVSLSRGCGCIVDTAAGHAGVIIIASSPSLLCIHGCRCHHCCAGMDALPSSSWPRHPHWLSSHGHGCIVNAAAGCCNVRVCGGRVVTIVAIVINASGGGGHITWSSMYFVVTCVRSCVSVILWVGSFNYN